MDLAPRTLVLEHSVDGGCLTSYAASRQSAQFPKHLQYNALAEHLDFLEIPCHKTRFHALRPVQ